MRQPDGIRAAPRDEFELHDPVQLGAAFVLGVPISVQTQHLAVQLVDHQDVRGHFALAFLVVFKFQVGVDVVDPAQAVFVVVVLATFNLVVGLLRLGRLRLHRRPHHFDITVHAHADAPIEFPLRDLVHLGSTLCGVEIAGRERQNHPVNG